LIKITLKLKMEIEEEAQTVEEKDINDS